MWLCFCLFFPTSTWSTGCSPGSGAAEGRDPASWPRQSGGNLCVCVTHGAMFSQRGSALYALHILSVEDFSSSHYSRDPLKFIKFCSAAVTLCFVYFRSSTRGVLQLCMITQRWHQLYFRGYAERLWYIYPVIPDGLLLCHESKLIR